MNRLGNDGSDEKSGGQLHVKAKLHTPAVVSGISDPIGTWFNVLLVNIFLS